MQKYSTNWAYYDDKKRREYGWVGEKDRVAETKDKHLGRGNTKYRKKYSLILFTKGTELTILVN